MVNKKCQTVKSKPEHPPDSDDHIKKYWLCPLRHHVHVVMPKNCTLKTVNRFACAVSHYDAWYNEFEFFPPTPKTRKSKRSSSPSKPKQK
nr:hypothetical protein BgiMline_024731 [Biomphalaria glabrata]